MKLLKKKRVKRAAVRRYRRSALWRAMHPRRFHAYCVGMPKTGTHSVAGMFERHYRSAHEPEKQQLVDRILAADDSSGEKSEAVRFIRKRDRQHWFELHSSFLDFYFLDALVTEFGGAKFILTIRDCYSWLDSYINHQLARGTTPRWTRFRDFRFRSGEVEYAAEEQVLAEHDGLYTLDEYLSYWARHNNKVLAAVPEDRLLIVRTREIRQDAGSIAAFLDIPLESLDTSRSHLYKAKERYGMVSEIDRAFLEEKVNEHCRPLMDRFFPE